MKEQEKLTLKSAFMRVETNLEKLRNSQKTFKDIFNISFQYDDYTLFNVMNVVDYETITYKEAKKWICDFSNVFLNDIDPSEKYIGIHLNNCKEWIYCFYSILASSHVPVLLSTNCDVLDLKSVIKRLGIKTVISDNLNCEVKVISLKEIYEKCASFKGLKKTLDECTFENEIVLTTSGVSDKPKIVLYTGSQICNQIFNSLPLFKANKTFCSLYKGYLKHLVILPFYHIFGLSAVFLWFSFFNLTFVLPYNLAPENIKRACLLTHVTHIFAVPLFWETLAKKIISEVKKNNKLDKFNKALDFSLKLQKAFPKLGVKIIKNVVFKKYLEKILGTSLSFAITGGGAISLDTLKIMNALGYTLRNGYGSTEIGITSFDNSLDINSLLTGNVGVPFDSIQYELVDVGNNLKELVVKGQTIASKIMYDDKFVDVTSSGIATNDIFYLKDGKYYITGRKDNIYVSKNGENYSLEAFETKIRFDVCNSFCVFPGNDNELCLVLSYSPNVVKDARKKDLLLIKNDRSELFKHIDKVFVTNVEIPIANGIKIKRRALRDIFLSNESLFELVDFSSLDNQEIGKKDDVNEEILNKIIGIYGRYFENQEINANTNYYLDLNGDSLTFFYLLSDIEKEFGVHLGESIKDIPTTPYEFTKIVMKEMNL